MAEDRTAVDVSFQIPCLTPDYPFQYFFSVLGIEVAEAAGNRLATASLFNPDPFGDNVGIVVCTSDEPQTLTLRLAAAPGPLFHPGEAIVTAFVFYQSTVYGFEGGTVSHPMRIDSP